ncbi:MAG: glutamate racemase [Solirubrobacteraceae bacterium]
MIGVFDSGVGGLTVLHELLVQLPQEDYVYLGDTARFPYGERSEAELRAFSLQNAQLLIERGAKLLLVACNSATAAALDSLRGQRWTVPVLGVVGPESALAVKATRSGRIGLLATPATVASGAYERRIAELAPAAELLSVPCPDLAPIIQGGFPFDQRVVDTVRGYCRPLIDAGVDTVILGCTHYPLVAPMLRRTLGPDVELVTSGAAAAEAVRTALTDANIATTSTGEGEYEFLCTGEVESFRKLGSHFLQMPLEQIQHVEMEVVA